MALKRTLAQRLFNVYRLTTPSITSCRVASSPAATTSKALAPPHPDQIAPDPGDGDMSRRFLHCRPMGPSSPETRSLPTGQGLIERLKGMDISRDRIRLEGLIPPARMMPEPEEGKLTVDDAKKLLRLSQLEMVKERLSRIEESCISRDDLDGICRDGCWSRDEAKQFAKTLDESGTVIILGNVVFLRPQQIVKAIQGLIVPAPAPHPNDPRSKELEAMEEMKAAIDRKAESFVRRELWCGLGCFVAQTAAFMRLTFWELSWDVMEPICFYVTSIYCMAGYAFFLRTSKEPSFEGFFQSRFSSKQKQLMKIQNFDLQRYRELRRAFDPDSRPEVASNDATSAIPWTKHDVKKTIPFQDMQESQI